MLDEGVPNSVGRVFEDAGHEVFYGNKEFPTKLVDQLVCQTALLNKCILVACDGDMKTIAKKMGLPGGKFKDLSLIKISTPNPDAASRIQEAMSLIEHEWRYSSKKTSRRIFIEIQLGVIRTTR